jgi:hypothetical protein
MADKKEYIERGALIGILDAKFEMAIGAPKAIFASVSKMVELLPAADVTEVVHGEWIAKDCIVRSPFARNYYCSVCKYEPLEEKNYCPDCGAKMDGERKEQT